MQQGEVKFFNNEKGFGFIKTSDEDLFFHITEVTDSREPQQGDKVSFEVGQNNKGKVATGVTITDTVQ